MKTHNYNKTDSSTPLVCSVTGRWMWVCVCVCNDCVICKCVDVIWEASVHRGMYDCCSTYLLFILLYYYNYFIIIL